MANKLAVITGASTGIGREIAKLAAEEGYDLLIVADEPEIDAAAGELSAYGAQVQTVQADLSTFEGNDQLLAATNGRPIDVLVANAGRGLGQGFLVQDVAAWRKVIDTNVTGTTYLLQKVLTQMVQRNAGNVLITGSIAGLIPGAWQAVYNATKAYVDSISYALREEVKDTEVNITVLMPGPTETEFFHRGDLDNTPVGQAEKADPAKVAKDGWEAMKARKPHIVSGLVNKLQAAASHITPDTINAKLHTAQAKPDDVEQSRGGL